MSVAGLGNYLLRIIRFEERHDRQNSSPCPEAHKVADADPVKTKPPFSRRRHRFEWRWTTHHPLAKILPTPGPILMRFAACHSRLKNQFILK